MLSHVALMMNPNLDEKELKEVLEKSFESKHRQLDGIEKMEREMEEGDNEAEARDQEILLQAQKWNKDFPQYWMPLPRVKSKAERRMERDSIAWRMRLMVLLY